MRHEEFLLQDNISKLKQLISDQNLQLLPDYGQRVSVLKELGFIDDNQNVLLKGRVACEVSHLPLSSTWLKYLELIMQRSIQQVSSS